MTDFELLDAWRAGDTGAGNKLLKRHFDALYRFFYNKVADHADDLIQATMIACVRGRDSFRKECGFRAYLFVVARHEFFRWLKKRARGREVFDPELMSVEALSPSPSSAVARRKEQRLLLMALRRIPADLQLILELHYWESLSTRELAEVVGIPQGTVKSRLRRARESLEKAMNEISDSPDEVESTLHDMERWVAGIREQIGAEPKS